MTYLLKLSLPPKGCSPNRRGDPRIHAKDISSYRTEARVIALEAMSGNKPDQKPVRITATFFSHVNLVTRERYRPSDEDNARASLKAALDGIRDSGLIPNDTTEWVSWGEVRIVRNSIDGSRPRVELRIEQI